MRRLQTTNFDSSPTAIAIARADRLPAKGVCVGGCGGASKSEHWLKSPAVVGSTHLSRRDPFGAGHFDSISLWLKSRRSSENGDSTAHADLPTSQKQETHDSLSLNSFVNA
ncbi:MAG: hypothetical protein HY562_01190 [Ignavibacteriales bacterium]|nr:hypothetical protein [Ignavibacteriales bacterium]